MAQPKQAFTLPFTNRVAGLTHSFVGASGLEPRKPRMLGRLTIADTGVPGLLTTLKAAGTNVLLGDGFPLFALAPSAQVDEDNVLAFPAGPDFPIELEATYTANSKIGGYIGIDPIPEVAGFEDAAMAAIEAGEILGSINWGWGLGQINVAAGASGSFNLKIPRAAKITRLVAYAYDTVAGAIYGPGNVYMTGFEIGGDDQFGRAGEQDVSLLSGTNTDEDGMSIDYDLDTSTSVLLSFDNTGANNALIQVGFFTNDYGA